MGERLRKLRHALAGPLQRTSEFASLHETLLLTAVATILVIRTQLWLTHYPQLGGGGLHIAHLLWGGLFDTSNVKIHGLAPMLRLLEQGRGAVLVCSHLGNADLCRVLSHQQPGLRITVLVHTRHAKAFNDMLAAIDPRSQMNLMQVTEMNPATAMILSEKVAQGEFVVIAGDRIPVSPAPRVALAPFLGAPAAFPVGPYVLASILQCPLCLMFSKQGRGGYEIHFEQLRDSVKLPRAGRDDALAELARAYAARLQYHCLRSPLEWFNFYDFWHSPHLDKNDASC